MDRLTAPLLTQIRAAWSGWKCRRGSEFSKKLAVAAACVVAGVLPAFWLSNVIDEMLVGDRKRRPARWLGKVLATTAKERGVDFDLYQRQIKTPEVP